MNEWRWSTYSMDWGWMESMDGWMDMRTGHGATDLPFAEVSE